MKQVIILLLLATPLYAQEGKIIERWKCWTIGGFSVASKPTFTAVVYEGKERGHVSFGGVLSEDAVFILDGFERTWIFRNEEGEFFGLGIFPSGVGFFVPVGGVGNKEYVDDDEKLICSME